MIKFIKITATCIVFASCNNTSDNMKPSTDTVTSLDLIPTSIDSTKSTIQLTNEYTALANQGKWEQALPVIETIVTANEKISTSWFNYGVCLDALGKHKKAAKSFLTAYELNPSDYGAQYRVYRSLSLANDSTGFASFLKNDIKIVPEIGKLLTENSEFKSMTSNSEVKKILKENH